MDTIILIITVQAKKQLREITPAIAEESALTKKYAQ